MQQVTLPFALTSALLGLTALQCGPAVARQPPPTPVYASELSVPPAAVTQESLREPVATRTPEPEPAPAESTDAETDTDVSATEEADRSGKAEREVETPAPPPPDPPAKTR